MKSIKSKSFTGKNFLFLLARLVDYSCVYFFLAASALFLPVFFDNIFYLALALLTPLLFIPIEAFLLSRLGTTLGMTLFGFSIYDDKGKKLSFFTALKRNLFLDRNSGVLEKKPSSVFKKCLGFSLVIACFCGSFAGKRVQDSFSILSLHPVEGSWIRYECPEVGFSVNFPSKPIMEPKQLSVSSANRTLNYNEYISYQDEQKRIYYSVSSIQLPAKWRLFSSSTLLKGALKVLTDSDYDIDLLRKGFTNHKTHPALDFHLKQGEDRVHGRLILINNTLYKLVAVYPPIEEESIKDQAFLDSFELTTQNIPKTT